MGISEAIARAQDARCDHPGCTATWQGNHQWATCRTCPGHPLTICKEHIRDHFESAVCQQTHKNRGVEGSP